MTLISVIIPVYNAAGFLPQAVESAFAAAQDALDLIILDLIIIDDGSMDATPRVAAELAARYAPAVRVVSQPNAGPAAARNHGLALARADLFAFLDADDQWPADKLQIQLAWLEAHPTHDFVLGRVQYTGLPGAVVPGFTFDDQNSITHVHLGSGLFRRRAFERFGFFDEAMRYSEDFDWLLRALESDVEFTILNAITLRYFVHRESMTYGKSVHEIRSLVALKKSLDRRRARPLPDGSPPPLKRWSDFKEDAR